MIIRPSIIKNVQLGGNLTEGLVGYWPLDGVGGTAYDRSGRGNNGIVYGATSAVSERGRCRGFDGTGDYVDLGNSAPQSDGNFTISAWIKSSSTSRSAIISNYDGSKYFTVEFNGNGQTTSLGQAAFVIDDGIVSNKKVASTSTDLNDSRWHHIVVVRVGTAIKINIDGVDEAITDIGSYGSLFSTVSAKIGRYGSLTTLDFNGQISDAAIHNRVLSSAEVQQLFRTGIPEQRDPIELWSAAMSGGAPPPTVNPYYYQQLLNRRRA